jgi:flagellar hook-length control protein FliK
MPAGSDVSGADLHAAFTPVEHRALETALKASTARARAGSPAPFAQDASFGRPSHGTAGGDGVIDLLLSQQPGSGAAGQLPVITEPALTSASLANQFMAQAHTQSLGSQSLPDSARPAAGAQVFDALAASQMPLTLAGGESAAEPLGERLIALATQGQQFAKLRLHPAELGALEVRIKLHDDGAAISISSHHAHVRDAIEATLPRLRELFASQGMDLVDVDVSGGEQHAPQGGDGAMDRDSQSHQFQSARAELTAVQSAALAGDRLVARRSTHRIDLLA